MKKKNILLIILFVIVIAAAVIAGILIYNNSDAVRLERQLDLGQRYLSELNYEEAIVAFNQAIEIDPRSADAYLGLADAYIGLGDEEAALAALERGYEATGDEWLKERMDEMKAAVIESEPEVAESVEENEANQEIAQRVLEISEIIYGQGGPNQYTSDGSSWLLTYDQIEVTYRPLAEELERYLEQSDENVMAWKELADIYLHLGEMEKCRETRRKGYEITGWYMLMPETYKDEEDNIYDEYGRTISYGDGYTCTYGEADRWLTWTWPDSHQVQYEYDDYGRISRVSQVESAEYIPGPDFVYEYQGDNSVILTGGANNTLITYNEYGIHLSRSDVTGAQ